MHAARRALLELCRGEALLILRNVPGRREAPNNPTAITLVAILAAALAEAWNRVEAGEPEALGRVAMVLDATAAARALPEAPRPSGAATAAGAAATAIAAVATAAAANIQIFSGSKSRRSCLYTAKAGGPPAAVYTLVARAARAFSARPPLLFSSNVRVSSSSNSSSSCCCCIRCSAGQQQQQQQQRDLQPNACIILRPTTTATLPQQQH
ncbi:hypothetical protein ACSSS7_004354 [Eimeria intestinalis]